jgi:hypothetical protein
MSSPQPESADERLIPVGVWIRLPLPQHPEYVGYTYVDQEMGLSAQNFQEHDPNNPESKVIIVRLPVGVPWEVLGEDEVRRRGLPDVPAAVAEFYGPQPARGTLWGTWRTHPKLAGRFHPEFPDDLQVLVHDGGPRLTDRRPELIWVRVTGADGDVFFGSVLNEPQQLKTVEQGSRIRFVVPEGGEHPLMVTEKYLRERPDWVIQGCNRCGLTELFDAPSDLIRVIFPNLPADAQLQAFTTFCGNCGGVQLVKNKSAPPEAAPVAPPGAPPAPEKKWWQFWK